MSTYNRRDASPTRKAADSKSTRGIRKRIGPSDQKVALTSLVGDNYYADKTDRELSWQNVETWMLLPDGTRVELARKRCTTYQNDSACNKLAAYKLINSIKKPKAVARQMGIDYSAMVLARVKFHNARGQLRTFWFGMKLGEQVANSTSDLLRFRDAEQATAALLQMQ
jgi:hypothetical protein